MPEASPRRPFLIVLAPILLIATMVTGMRLFEHVSTALESRKPRLSLIAQASRMLTLPVAYRPQHAADRITQKQIEDTIQEQLKCVRQQDWKGALAFARPNLPGTRGEWTPTHMEIMVRNGFQSMLQMKTASVDPALILGNFSKTIVTVHLPDGSQCAYQYGLVRDSQTQKWYVSEVKTVLRNA